MLVDEGRTNRVHISELFEVPDAVNGIFREAFAVKVVVTTSAQINNTTKQFRLHVCVCMATNCKS